MGSVTGRWRLGDVRDARGLGDVRSASACRVNGLRLSSRARRDAASERRRPNLPDTRPEDRFPPAMVSWGAAQCVLRAEAGDEASAGERIGQPLSRERINRGADAVVSAEGETGVRVNASPLPALRGRRPWHVWTLLPREPGDLWIGHRPYWVAWSAAGSHYRPVTPISPCALRAWILSIDDVPT